MAQSEIHREPEERGANQRKPHHMPNRDRRTNRLLSLLSDDDYQRLRPHLSLVVLDYKKSLYEASRPIEHVYFPIDGVASLVITTSDGHSAEVGTIGSEGIVGLPICLGDDVATSSVYVQVPGTALQMDARTFRGELDRNPALNLVMLRYAHAFFNQVAQSAACAHLHQLEQRCCRWLLMTRDRMPSGDFLLTQEFLGMMLGVRRTSVTDVMGSLQKDGLVRYRRGHVTILDPEALRQRACECYDISKREFDRLLGDTAKSPRTDKKNRSVREVG
ncbi:MAG: Crp/Fnr family transcriptional regulator [Bradyrhizobium sp.]|nr:Crp/Fnr family transcriptional regulator [Bradyrhizobium sp.]